MRPGALEAALERIGRPIVVASYPRSGTHLTIDLLRRQLGVGAWKLPAQSSDATFLPIERLLPGSHNPLSDELALRRLRRAERPVIKTHAPADLGAWVAACPVWATWLRERGDFVYVCRDGRDVLCSMHLWQQGFDPATRVPLPEFIRQPIPESGPRGGPQSSRARAWAQHVMGWMDSPEVMTVQFERLQAEPRAQLELLGQRLGIEPRFVEPLLPAPLRSRAHAVAERFLSLRPEATTHRGRPRGYVLERWAEALDTEDLRFLQDEAGDALLRLGYETSADWWRSPRG